MNEFIIPNLRYREYLTEDVIKVVNPKQQKLYVKHGAFPVDMYVDQDKRGYGDILIMVFMRDETQELYDAWVNHELV